MKVLYYILGAVGAAAVGSYSYKKIKQKNEKLTESVNNLGTMFKDLVGNKPEQTRGKPEQTEIKVCIHEQLRPGEQCPSCGSKAPA